MQQAESAINKPPPYSVMDPGPVLEFTNRRQWERLHGRDERLLRSRDVSPDRWERFTPTNPNLEPTLYHQPGGRWSGGEVLSSSEYDSIINSDERRLAASRRALSRKTDRLRTPTIASENKITSRAQTADATMLGGRPPWRDVGGWEGQSHDFEEIIAPELPKLETYDFLNETHDGAHETY